MAEGRRPIHHSGFRGTRGADLATRFGRHREGRSGFLFDRGYG
jgi:hypothetical protein